ncbi:MAG: hypothetical protein COB50_02380 [Thiotrichales bacterium]|nr:MAG: hypothetical protein COB50_02380 [Thiotrichales bacterium]
MFNIILSIVTICCALATSAMQWQSPASLLHVFLSITAASILAIAAGQAMIIAIQHHLLRQQMTTKILKLFPPLQTMTNILFKLIWLGFIALSAALASTLLLNNYYAPAIIHKTVLSMCAWGLFATMLYGHLQAGWPGITAVRLTIIGTSLLIISYFGSKVFIGV